VFPLPDKPFSNDSGLSKLFRPSNTLQEATSSHKELPEPLSAQFRNQPKLVLVGAVPTVSAIRHGQFQHKPPTKFGNFRTFGPTEDMERNTLRVMSVGLDSLTA
jgi:hypothetical protein